MRKNILIFVAVVCVTSPIAFAGNVYKCSGKDGSTVFSDSPCGADAQKVDTSRSKARVGSVYETLFGAPHEYEYHQLDSPSVGLPIEVATMGLQKWCGFYDRPRVNRTTRAGEVSEQWVCSGNRYLYFRNGVLVSIQD